MVTASNGKNGSDVPMYKARKRNPRENGSRSRGIDTKAEHIFMFLDFFRLDVDTNLRNLIIEGKFNSGIRISKAMYDINSFRCWGGTALCIYMQQGNAPDSIRLRSFPAHEHKEGCTQGARGWMQGSPRRGLNADRHINERMNTNDGPHRTSQN